MVIYIYFLNDWFYLEMGDMALSGLKEFDLAHLSSLAVTSLTEGSEIPFQNSNSNSEKLEKLRLLVGAGAGTGGGGGEKLPKL